LVTLYEDDVSPFFFKDILTFCDLTVGMQKCETE
jgi:hypothetical protein